MKSILFSIALGFMGVGCAPSNAQDVVPSVYDKAAIYTSIYWSDADSGRLGKLKFRLANVDAPETGSMKQRGGAKCEFERERGYESKAYIVGFTKGKAIRIVRDYGEDRYGRSYLMAIVFSLIICLGLTPKALRVLKTALIITHGSS